VPAASLTQMLWNPLNVLELPKFVYSFVHPGLGRLAGTFNVSKTAMSARQRMETPVIYFYTERPRTVDVAVDFPEGTMSEWYPQARFAEELATPVTERKPSARNTLRWQNVSIEPATAPSADPSRALPHESAGSHYYSARETDSALVKIEDRTGHIEREKFLFYRGVGNFIAPLTVKTPGQDGSDLLLSNDGAEELRHLFAYEVRAGRGRWITVDRLSPHEQTPVKLAGAAELSVDELRDVLGKKIRAALVSEGLFEHEATAMIKTWDESWFAEQGVRVLYMLPRAWTDRTLPLRLTPAPRAVARVMVGRAEIITPAMERDLVTEVDRFISGASTARKLAAENTRRLGLGRFAEATLRHLLVSSKRSAEFSTASWQLLQESSK
jgi:hypothetical protein